MAEKSDRPLPRSTDDQPRLVPARAGRHCRERHRARQPRPDGGAASVTTTRATGAASGRPCDRRRVGSPAREPDQPWPPSEEEGRRTAQPPPRRRRAARGDAARDRSRPRGGHRRPRCRTERLRARGVVVGPRARRRRPGGRVRRAARRVRGGTPEQPPGPGTAARDGRARNPGAAEGRRRGRRRTRRGRCARPGVGGRPAHGAPHRELGVRRRLRRPDERPARLRPPGAPARRGGAGRPHPRRHREGRLRRRRPGRDTRRHAGDGR